tara:strand:- start:31 stop:378 length:348 start_codon:yes stop_codon:yes gene_type:complete
MDKIFIKELEIETVIGIYDWEREVKQLISVSLEMNVDTKKASRTQKVSDSLDYKRVSKKIISLTKRSKSKLIENLAHKIATSILSEFPVSKVIVTLEKPGALRGSKSVGVVIERP